MMFWYLLAFAAAEEKEDEVLVRGCKGAFWDCKNPVRRPDVTNFDECYFAASRTAFATAFSIVDDRFHGNGFDVNCIICRGEVDKMVPYVVTNAYALPGENIAMNTVVTDNTCDQSGASRTWTPFPTMPPTPPPTPKPTLEAWLPTPNPTKAPTPSPTTPTVLPTRHPTTIHEQYCDNQGLCTPWYGLRGFCAGDTESPVEVNKYTDMTCQECLNICGTTAQCSHYGMQVQCETLPGKRANPSFDRGLCKVIMMPDLPAYPCAEENILYQLNPMGRNTHGPTKSPTFSPTPHPYGHITVDDDSDPWVIDGTPEVIFKRKFKKMFWFYWGQWYSVGASEADEVVGKPGCCVRKRKLALIENPLLAAQV